MRLGLPKGPNRVGVFPLHLRKETYPVFKTWYSPRYLGPISQLHGMLSGLGWSKWHTAMEDSGEYIEYRTAAWDLGMGLTTSCHKK
jgi:hypothetical protein